MWTPEEISRWKRNVKAMVQSAGNNDPEAFASLVEISDWLATVGLRDAYDMLHLQGFSGSEIARPMGVTKQAAWHRFRRR